MTDASNQRDRASRDQQQQRHTHDHQRAAWRSRRNLGGRLKRLSLVLRPLLHSGDLFVAFCLGLMMGRRFIGMTV